MLRNIARGSAWMVAARLADRGLGLLSMLIMARLLVPADFGLVAMAMTVIVTLELMSLFSFDVALVQLPQADRAYYDSAFTLNLMLRGFIALLIAVLAWPAASFYDEPRLAGILLVLSIGWCAQAFENIGTVNFRRELRFGREFAFQATKRLVSFLVTLLAALAWQSYWALILGMVVGRVTGLVLSYTMEAYRPRLALVRARELMSFSSWLLVNNLLYVVNTRLGSFVVGKLHGATSLGHYNIAREIGSLSTSELVVPLERVLMAGYSRLTDDYGQLRRIFLTTLAGMAAVALPAAIGITAVAEPLVHAALSEKWIDAAPFVKVFSLLGATTAVLSSMYPLYISIGRPRYATFHASCRFLIFLVGLWVMVPRGALGAAQAELLASALMLPIGWGWLMKVLHIRLTALVSSIWRPMVASALMYMAVRYSLTDWPLAALAAAPWGQLCAAVAVGVFVYAASIALLWLASGRPDSVEASLTRLAWTQLGRITR